VGISIGITRLLPRLIEAGVMKLEGATVAPELITSLDRSRMIGAGNEGIGRPSPERGLVQALPVLA
jgi:hypothetical protein